MDLAKKALMHYGGETLAQELLANGLGNHPELVKMFAKVGGQLAEDGLIGRSVNGVGGGKAPAEAQQEIAGLYQDKAFLEAYGNKRAPGHGDAVKRMQTLYEAAHPAS